MVVHFKISINQKKTAKKYFLSKHKPASNNYIILLQGEVKKVISNIKRIDKNSETISQCITYKSKNKNRIQYQKYLKTRCEIIASGAVESANGTQIEKRMKQSVKKCNWYGA